MHIYGPAHLHGPQSLAGPHSARQTQATGSSFSDQYADEVQISDAARLAEAHGDADIRYDRVAEIRAQIASGTYETPEKLDAALERMLDEIG